MVSCHDHAVPRLLTFLIVEHVEVKDLLRSIPYRTHKRIALEKWDWVFCIGIVDTSFTFLLPRIENYCAFILDHENLHLIWVIF